MGTADREAFQANTMKRPTTYHNEAGDGTQGGGAPTLLNDPALTGAPAPTEAPPSILKDWTADGGALKPEFLETIGKAHPELAPTFSKYKTEAELFKGIANLATLAGKKTEGIRVPGPDAKPEEIAEFRKALGVPETVDGYEIAKPEDLPEGVQWSEDTVKAFAGVLHKHGVPPAVAADLVALDIERRKAEVEAFKAEEAQHIETQRQALRDEFGAELPQKLATAARAAALIGLPADHYALADATVIKALVTLAGKVGEDRMATKAEAPGADLTAKVAELQASESYKKGDPAIRAEVHRLNMLIVQREGVTD